jgi:hypothetical protein
MMAAYTAAYSPDTRRDSSQPSWSELVEKDNTRRHDRSRRAKARFRELGKHEIRDVLVQLNEKWCGRSHFK